MHNIIISIIRFLRIKLSLQVHVYKMTLNNRCLFCGNQTTMRSCCTPCSRMSRNVMFDTLLTLLGNATKFSNYYDQLKIISQEVETVSAIVKQSRLYSLFLTQLEWFLTPVEFNPITLFDPTVHKIDQHAKVYLENGCVDIQGMVPIDVIADGNCLYHSIICLNGTTNLTVNELRGIHT